MHHNYFIALFPSLQLKKPVLILVNMFSQNLLLFSPLIWKFTKLADKVVAK